MELEPGTLLDDNRYEIVELLGSGAFGQSYKAKAKRRPGNPLCVVKQITPSDTDPQTLEEAKKLFEREAHALEQLGNHNQIPRLIEHFFDENKKIFYIVQDFIDGHNLTKELLTDQPLGEDEVITLLQEILEILAFVHDKEMIHRDIKPANIMRRKSDKKLVLIDFGAVKQISTLQVNSQGRTTFSTVIGSEGYRPNEQAPGYSPAPTNDIYAVGMVGIKALTGVHCPTALPKDPFSHEFIWPEAIRKSNLKLKNVLEKMVKYNSKDRYKSVKKVLEELKKLTNSGSHSKLKSLVLRARRLTRELNPLFGIIAAIAAIAAIPSLNDWIKTPKNPDPKPSIEIPAPGPGPDTFNIYNNQSEGISIKYPQNWTEDPNPPLSTIVAFVSPLESNSDKFQENLTITVGDSQQSQTLEQLTQEKIKEISNSRGTANVIIANSPITLADNLSANQLVYSGQSGQYNLIWRQILIVKNKKAYIIIFEAETGKDRDYLKILQKMLDSLEIK